MIQEGPIWRTMWGPCFGHKRAIFWPFPGKEDYRIHPEIWNLAWSIPGHIDYDSGRTNLKNHVRTMFWPWKGHVLAIFRKRGLWDSPRIVKFGMEHPWACRLWLRKNKFWGPCEDYVFAINGHILAISKKRGLQDTPRILNFCMEPPWAHWLIFRSNHLEGQC